MSEERGTASLELALVGPVLMLLVLGVLQFGLWYHAQQVVGAAALEAARAAAAEDGSAAAGHARAMELLAHGLGSAAEGREAAVSMGQDVATVRVTARLRALLPLPGVADIPLRAEASAFRERFRPAEEAG